MDDDVLSAAITESFSWASIDIDYVTSNGDHMRTPYTKSLGGNSRVQTLPLPLYDLRDFTSKPLTGAIEFDFVCRYHRLTDLRGGPISVGADYKVTGNPLTCFNGIPNRIGGNFSLVNARFVFDRQQNRIINLDLARRPCASAALAAAAAKLTAPQRLSFTGIHTQLKHLGGDFYLGETRCHELVGVIDLLRIDEFVGEFVVVNDAHADIYSTSLTQFRDELRQLKNIINEGKRLGGRVGLMTAHRQLSALARSAKYLKLPDLL